MSFEYHPHPQFPDSILIREFFDEINVDQIMASWEYLTKSNVLTPSVKGVINQISECKLSIDLNSFHQLIDYLKHNELLRNIHLAVICNDPKILVFPTLAELEVKELHIKAFSTVNAAIEWILME